MGFLPLGPTWGWCNLWKPWLDGAPGGASSQGLRIHVWLSSSFLQALCLLCTQKRHRALCSRLPGSPSGLARGLSWRRFQAEGLCGPTRRSPATIPAWIRKGWNHKRHLGKWQSCPQSSPDWSSDEHRPRLPAWEARSGVGPRPTAFLGCSLCGGGTAEGPPSMFSTKFRQSCSCLQVLPESHGGPGAQTPQVLWVCAFPVSRGTSVGRLKRKSATGAASLIFKTETFL